MDLICPISQNRVNEKVVRMNAFFVLICLMLILLLNIFWLIYFLVIDFGIKSFYSLGRSPVSQLSKNLVNFFKIKPKLINAGPKLFAARTGLLICSSSAVLVLINAYTSAILLLSLLAVFVSLECFIGFCTACYIISFISYLHKQFIKPTS
ncbi:MAG: DUF4395 domain-containing protein [Bacteroidales bacterium]|nr:DUF4395 domain-containing protein [Bacteroidales bacterium]MCF8404687.1 DUF4395 domain-containing protein [Bacteroidales bacterium]